jgi:ABC-type glutathione transport system ATPase component
MVEDDRLTVLLVTHDRELAGSFADRIITMKDGRIVE